MLEEGRTPATTVIEDIHVDGRVEVDNIRKEVDEITEMLNMDGEEETDREEDIQDLYLSWQEEP